MCGILAVLGVLSGGESIKTSVLERVRRLRHRGPDWSGCYVKGTNVLAHERLAIVDLDNGAQPLFNEKKDVILAVNGEIYNHKQLKKTAFKEPKTFLTESDCEVIIPLYETFGIHFLNLLNGIFAFVLLDERTGQFIIARDHMGIIPLYWGRDAEGAVWVASELKALHDVCVTFEDFPPGHVYDSAKNEKVKWYAPAWQDEAYLPSAQLDLKALKLHLEDAVRRQLMSDVPYGVLLSGGLDSSLIAAIASRICSNRVEDDGKSEAWWPRLHSFSIGLKGSPDLAAARTVAKFLKTVHHEYVFTVEEGLNAYNDVIYHLETYDVTTIRAATPMYLMSRKIKALGVKMVLSGEGSDEIFGGYLYFHRCPNREELQKELVRKLKALYKFDCLRANKATASWGVEARVPFLDKEFMDFAMNDIDPKDKLCGFNAPISTDPKRKIEKYILRKAFESDNYLPEEVLWRQKEQFSDGVGYSWIDSIKEQAERKVSDAQMSAAQYRFPYNTPNTKEAYYIRSIFELHFPQKSAAECVPGGPSVACSTPAALLWDESFRKFADCSGRSVAGVHESAYDDSARASAKGEKVDDQKLEQGLLSFKGAVIDKEAKTVTDDAKKSANPSPSPSPAPTPAINGHTTPSASSSSS